MSFFVGVDVGGTNTDAVLCRGEKGVYSVVAARKAPSVREQGVVDALRGVLVAEVEPSQIAGIFIGTTQFINAVVERRHLSKVSWQNSACNQLERLTITFDFFFFFFFFFLSSGLCVSSHNFIMQLRASICEFSI
jgi:membrane protein insertase Oxa1/YidC/SpoIIIJ